MLKNRIKKIMFVLFPLPLLLLLVFLFYTYVIKTPSNSKNWEFGFTKNAQISYSNNNVLINNVRNFKYNSSGAVSTEYTSLTLDPNKIESSYFILEPFSAFGAVAHSFLQFNFSDGQKVLASVEARRTKGQQFNAFTGLFNNYELIYVWGTEQDLIGRRLLVEKSEVYKFPLTISHEYSKNLFLQMVSDTKNLQTKPKFYNSLTSNCTNLLAMAANKIKPGVVPYDISWVLPGFSDKFLNKIGFIDLSKGREYYLVKSLN